MPNQLTFKEVKLIEQFVLNPEYRNWSLISIYYKLIRESERFFSDRTYYKYVSILGLRRSKNKKPKAKNTGPRANRPLQLLHMDITEYWITDNIKAYLHIVMDNYSRKILGFKVALNKSAELACENLKEVYKKFNLAGHKDVMIMINDNGSENYDITKQFIESLPNMTQYFANRKKRKQWTNNMIEALFCKMKGFVREYEYRDFDSFVRKFEDIKELCNDKIPIAATGGRTPNEAFEGINPFSDSLTSLIQRSHIQRVMENRNGRCF
jgi:putative transposase